MARDATTSSYDRAWRLGELVAQDATAPPLAALDALRPLPAGDDELVERDGLIVQRGRAASRISEEDRRRESERKSGVATADLGGRAAPGIREEQRRRDGSSPCLLPPRACLQRI